MQTPKQLLDSIIPQMKSCGTDIEQMVTLMCDTWRDNFPTVQYIKEVTVATSSAVLLSEADELWGMEELDIGKDIAMSTMASSTSVDGGINIPAHIADGLSRTQLERMNFKYGGGLVLTLLNPLLADLSITLSALNGFSYRGTTFKVLEFNEVVNWEVFGGKLYTVVNCGA